jgi:lipopolysaccharide biosynthesis glycosyltransferase
MLIRVLSGNGFIEDAMKFVERIKRSPESASVLVGPLKGQIDWFAAYDKFKATKCEWHEAAARSGAPVIAVVDYKQPDITSTSSNVGDYIQTISMLGCIARLSNIEIEGHDTLTSAVSQLRARVRQDRIATGQGGKIALTVVDRDATLDVPPPPGTWMLAFGWHMHKSFTDSLAFPFHPSVRPIFISFHCNKQEMLTEDRVDYLKRFAPIGCRDWTTVYFLRSRGVPAFFSGCVTTTIDTLFAQPEEGTQSRQTAFIDSVPSAEERSTPFKQIAHAQPTYRWADFASNLQRAVALLDEYRTQYDRIVTSRLHAYLPCAAIGLNVEFRPNNPSDIRFDGLANLGREEIEEIRAPLLAKTAVVLNLIAEGVGPEEVYRAWAEMCREDVEKANARCSVVPDIRLPAEDVNALVAGPMKSRISHGEFDPGVDPASIVHVGLAADKSYTPYLCVVLQSILRNSRRPIQFHVLARGFEQKHYNLIGSRFASGKCCVDFFPCDNIDHGNIIGMYARTTVSTMDRLLLPKLLPEVDRLAYIDIDAVVLGDVGELYDLDLAGHPLAARGSIASEASGGFSHVIPASVRLAPARAIEFRRRMAARTDLAYPTFNAGVLVLDLKQLREIDFCEQFLPYVSRYGLNDQQLLNCFAGGNWRPLAKEWNAWPTQELLESPKLVHFISFTKPWMGNRLPFNDAWEAYQSEVSDLVTLLP